MSTERDNLQTKVEGFMNSNYPCDCDPKDPDCPKNFYETDYMLDLIGEDVISFIEGLPADLDRDRLIEELRTALFIPKVVTTHEP